MLENYEPQVSFLGAKAQSINEHLTKSYTPLQLIAITSIATAIGIGVYQFVFGDDESKIQYEK